MNVSRAIFPAERDSLYLHKGHGVPARYAFSGMMRYITWQLVSSLLLNGFSFCTVDASATVLSIRTESLRGTQ